MHLYSYISQIVFSVFSPLATRHLDKGEDGGAVEGVGAELGEEVGEPGHGVLGLLVARGAPGLGAGMDGQPKVGPARS